MLAKATLVLLHLLAATVWIGGMVAMHFAVRPAAASTLEPPARLSFMGAALARFFAWVTAAIVVLLLTGLALIVEAGGFGAMHWSVHAMFGLGLLMMAIFGYIRVALFTSLQRSVAAGEFQAAATWLGRVRILIVTNLLLGVLVYALAIMGRVL